MMDYDTASLRAGELYGSLLHRDSDTEGFAHAVTALSEGQSGLRDLVRNICTSEEFREKHVMNQTPNELARQMLACLLNIRRPAPGQIKALAVRLLEQDWRRVIGDIIDSDGYAAVHGEDRVPRWA